MGTNWKNVTCAVCGLAFCAHAAGVGVGCAGYNVQADSACDPLKHQRHHEYIEQDGAMTSTTSVSAIVVSGGAMFAPGTQEEAMLDWWWRPQTQPFRRRTMIAALLAGSDERVMANEAKDGKHTNHDPHPESDRTVGLTGEAMTIEHGYVVPSEAEKAS